MLDGPASRVAITSCEGYDPALLSQKIPESLSLVGGLEQFITPGMKVLLKPNLLSAKEPHRAITTHPEFIAAVAREVKKLGAHVMVGDSPGGAKRGVKRVWDNTGMSTMAEREGIELKRAQGGGSIRRARRGR